MPNWRSFVLRCITVFGVGSLALFILLALADPWGTLPFRSPLPRIPADHSQRWAYPELARSPRFDAAIIGNSTSRLFNPADLDPALDARFVNLAMVHSFAYEQMQLLDVFLRAHPAPRALMVGLDRIWCERGDDLEHFGYGPLPEWLYRGDTLESLANLFNMHAIETAWRSASALLGASPRAYGPNGYQLLDVDSHPYNPALAQRLIAENLAEPWLPPTDPNPATWHYVALDWLRQRTDRLPPSTRLLLVFVPRHHLYPAPNTVGAAMIAECKRRVVAAAQSRPNTAVYDLSLPGPMTMDESRWWDAVHMRPEPMAQLSHELGAAVAGAASPDVKTLFTSAAKTLSAR
ncbi:MAG: hypothetical protein RQ966_02195 [Acetobacteraceae bacterium]|nr:hypothetical protein [Acetobacteraceae bacterium]